MPSEADGYGSFKSLAEYSTRTPQLFYWREKERNEYGLIARLSNVQHSTSHQHSPAALLLFQVLGVLGHSLYGTVWKEVQEQIEKPMMRAKQRLTALVVSTMAINKKKCQEEPTSTAFFNHIREKKGTDWMSRYNIRQEGWHAYAQSFSTQVPV